jgi:hypothetical protein
MSTTPTSSTPPTPLQINGPAPEQITGEERVQNTQSAAGKLVQITRDSGVDSVDPNRSTRTEAMRHRKTSSTTKYLRGVPASKKADIRRLFRSRLIEKGLWRGGRTMSAVNDDMRQVLERVIFEIVDAFESTDRGRPFHPITIALHDARNRVCDDLGWNEDVQRDDCRRSLSTSEQAQVVGS